MKYQRGITLTGLLTGGAILFVVALLGMKVTPAWIEYGKIKQAVEATAKDTALRGASVGEVRVAYSKRAEINQISEITAKDLDISKDGDQLVIDFAYEARVPLFANASLLFEFQGSSGGE